ncbi:Hypothetical protein PACV_281 [Pacmanvirus A23]|uniref:Hypothetical protein n=1 Tax=Pacmanvirus A23 TaxID=1932881 RepID=UPI000A095D07|nr:Hypothetical protein B9W72_gp277 [Pacmanvirus A23]SIP85994.1 Hypothetical protein PACV_281 [Pacmanvirus A23]
MPQQTAKIVGVLTICTGVICGALMLVGLFFSGLVASGVNSATTKMCTGIEFETDCMSKCGCGWCEHTVANKTAGYCYPIDNNQCTGRFNNNLPDSCQEKYDNAIIAVIVFGSLAACCLLTVFCGLFIEACAFCCERKTVTVVGGDGPDIDNEADL